MSPLRPLPRWQGHATTARWRPSFSREHRHRATGQRRVVRELVTIGTPAMAAGAAVEFFFDPRTGRKRRHQLHDRATAMIRRRVRRVDRFARYHAGKLTGLAHTTMPCRHSDDLDDITLVRKVETELFRDRTVPKGQISINADHGIVVLRGQIDDAWQVAPIEQAVRKIHGVRDVDNLLHPPAIPAPATRAHRYPPPGQRQ